MLAVSSFNHSAGLLYSAKLILVQLAHPKILGMSGAVKEQWITGLSSPFSSTCRHPLYPKCVSSVSSPPSCLCIPSYSSVEQTAVKWRMWGRGKELGGLRECGNTVSGSLSDRWSDSTTRLYTQCFWGECEFLFLALEAAQNWRLCLCCAGQLLCGAAQTGSRTLLRQVLMGTTVLKGTSVSH